jgi:hypothetical protein
LEFVAFKVDLLTPYDSQTPLRMINPLRTASTPQKACNYWEITDLLSGVVIIKKQRGALPAIKLSLQIMVVIIIWYRGDHWH